MSTEYTPTTEQVRDVYTDFGIYPADDFDRWLAGVRRQAKADGWDELYATAYSDADGQPDITDPNNPYRREQS